MAATNPGGSTLAMEASALATARSARIADVINDLRVYGRRAKTPEDRVALAELEREMLQVRERWNEAGMLPPPDFFVG